MPLERWDLNRAADLTDFYNEQIRSLPFGYPVMPEELTAGMTWSQAPQLIDHECEELVTFVDHGKILAMVHLGCCRYPGSDEKLGLIRFFACQSDCVDEARDALRCAEKLLAERDLHRIIAFPIEHGYRCYQAGRGFLVDRWTHILGLLRTQGYEYDEGQVLLQMESLDRTPFVTPDPISDIEVVVTPGAGDSTDLRIELVRGDQQLGRCTSRGLSVHHSTVEARDQFIVEGLHVTGDLRGQGWGRYLLSRMHHERAEQGYRRATIGTDRDNSVALLLYGSCGYQITCSEWTFCKSL